MSMKMRFPKTALSITTAVVTLASTVTAVNAAQRNEITLSSSQSSAQSGETFNITLGYQPDDVGASGFTIDLHYDTEAVNLNIPSDGGYTAAGEFAVVTNFEAQDGVIRIVGANLSGGNVNKNVTLGDFSFTVKDGYHGDISFWTDVTTLVATEGENFVNVDFRAFGPYDPFVVDGPAEETTTTPPQTTVPETEAPEDSEPETDEPVQTEPPKDDEEIVTEPDLPDNYIPEIPVVPEIPEELPETDNKNTEPTEAVFHYSQGDEDYNNEEPVQYSFSPYDYIDEVDGSVDISVSVSSDGSTQGGIGMLTSDGWIIYGGEIEDGSEEVWTAEDVDLDDVYGDISVQLYYQRNNSDFYINSISVTPADSEIIPDDDIYEPEDEDYYEDEDSSDGEIYDDYEPQQPADSVPDEITDSSADDSYIADEQPSDSADEQPSTDEENSADEDSETEEPSDSEIGSAEDTFIEVNEGENAASAGTADVEQGSDSSSDNSSTTDGAAEQVKGSDSAQQVEQIVNEASSTASDSNPETGAAGFTIAGILGLLLLFNTDFIQKKIKSAKEN
ncbi:MAG: hypothetical protein ACI4JW_09575 [Oscillospiraceae bacterium]